MNLTTKGAVALAALRKTSIASNATLTDTEPQSVEDALVDLELMLAEWQMNDNDRGISLGYLFSAPGVAPKPDDPHGLPDFAVNAAILNLATRIINDYGQEPSQTLVINAAYARERLVKWLSRWRTPHLRYPSRMPLGSGNQRGDWPRFYRGNPKKCP